jgi:hypothetical protein
LPSAIPWETASFAFSSAGRTEINEMINMKEVAAGEARADSRLSNEG